MENLYKYIYLNDDQESIFVKYKNKVSSTKYSIAGLINVTENLLAAQINKKIMEKYENLYVYNYRKIFDPNTTPDNNTVYSGTYLNDADLVDYINSIIGTIVTEYKYTFKYKDIVHDIITYKFGCNISNYKNSCYIYTDIPNDHMNGIYIISNLVLNDSNKSRIIVKFDNSKGVNIWSYNNNIRENINKLIDKYDRSINIDDWFIDTKDVKQQKIDKEKKLSEELRIHNEKLLLAAKDKEARFEAAEKARIAKEAADKARFEAKKRLQKRRGKMLRRRSRKRLKKEHNESTMLQYKWYVI